MVTGMAMIQISAETVKQNTKRWAKVNNYLIFLVRVQFYGRFVQFPTIPAYIGATGIHRQTHGKFIAVSLKPVQSYGQAYRPRPQRPLNPT